MIGYLGLFIAALVAATLLPMQSEAVLVALLLEGSRPATVLIVVATAGNVLGACINWAIGRFALRWRSRRWFPVSEAALARAQTRYARYGRWSLLGCWLPIIGDPLTVVAGLMREPFAPFLLLVTLAKGARYVLLATATLGWA